MFKRIFNVTLLLIILMPFGTVNAETDKNEIDLVTTPEKVFFDINNSKPGDVFTKSLNIKNNGKQDFKYLFSNSFLNGSEMFYDELLLKVEDTEGVLFDGKLKDFEKLDPRELKSNSSEKLTFYVEFPYELGNEYQGLSTEFQFKFYVEGTLGGVIPVDNKLPNTATDMFNYLIAGAALATGGGALMLRQKRKKLKQEE
jgi:LPXTG-motif cell wall-anchored protein